MRSVPLSDNLADKSDQSKGQSEAGAIHAEIAVRVLELREIKGERYAIGFFQKCTIIWSLYPAAFWVLMHLMTGDLTEITRSYTDMGMKNARSKQAVQQEWERILSALQPHYPELVKAIVHMRNISAKLKEDEKEQGV